MSRPEAGQWWFPDRTKPGRSANQRGVFIIGRDSDGRTVYQCDKQGTLNADDAWSDWHHEPRCTGWDWVVPDDQQVVEVLDRRGVVLVPGQKVFVLQTEQTRIASVVEVTENRSSNGWWVDVDFGSGPEGIPSDILEVCNAPMASHVGDSP